jgi:hypothetical protein
LSFDNVSISIFTLIHLSTLLFPDEDTNSELNNIFDAPIEPRQPHDYDEFIAYLSDLLLKGGVSKGNPLLYVEYPQHKDPSSMESSVHNMKRSR